MNKGLTQSGSGVYISPVVPAYNAAVSPGVVFTHNLGTPHLRVTWSLVCLKADHGFSPGDEIDLPYVVVLLVGMQAWRNASQVGLFVDDAFTPGFYIYGKTVNTTATLTGGNWGVRVRVEAILP